MKCICLLLVLFTGLCFSAEPTEWRIAIIGDTHDSPPRVAGNEGVAADFIATLYKQILTHKPDMVIQVGDLADTEGGDHKNRLPKRDELNAELKKKGIPFYCLRGNHDDTPIRKQQFPQLFIPKGDKVIRHGLNYGILHKNATLFFTDIEMNPGQLVQFSEWIKHTRKKPGFNVKHCLVFSHCTLHTPMNFRECIWGPSNDSAAEEQNTFYGHLKEAGCHFFITGHLHHHNLFTITSPDGKHKLTSLICAPAGNKILPTPLLLPEKERVSRHVFRTYVTGYYIITVKKDTLILDTYLAPYDGIDDTCPAPNNFFKLRSVTIPMER